MALGEVAVGTGAEQGHGPAQPGITFWNRGLHLAAQLIQSSPLSKD